MVLFHFTGSLLSSTWDSLNILKILYGCVSDLELLACILVCRFSVVFRFSLESLSVSCGQWHVIGWVEKNGASDASDKIDVALPGRTR